jgi:DNA-binding MarR family transcriptional regulator
VERIVDAADRRNVRASLTVAGRAAFERASAILAEHERAIDERLGRAPRAELVRGLQTIREG